MDPPKGGKGKRMSKVSMISNARHLYGGRALVSNQSFEANNETDAQELEILGFASRVKSAQPTYETKPMVAQQGAEAPTGAAEQRVKRQYKRRDMTQRP